MNRNEWKIKWVLIIIVLIVIIIMALCMHS